MLSVCTDKRANEVHIYYDLEGKEYLISQLTFARRDEDHAFFLFDLPLNENKQMNENRRMCDFLNVIYNNKDEDRVTIDDAPHGCSTVEMFLSRETMDLLLEAICGTNANNKGNELRNKSVAIKLTHI